MECETRYRNKLACTTNRNIHSVCNMIIGVGKTTNCPQKKLEIADFHTNFNQFNSTSKGEKYGVYYPPRRKEICLDIIDNMFTDDTSNCLIDAFASVAKIEGELLWEKYTDKNKAMMAIRRSYADLSDIIKGTDLWIDEDHTKKANGIIKDLFYINGERSKDGITRKEWWNKYRRVIWKGMLCGIKDKVKKEFEHEQLCFFHDDFDEIPQSLRCFVEWTEQFCEERLKKIQEFKKKVGEENKPESCKELGSCNAQNGEPCEEACKSYKEWTDKKLKEYNQQLNKYNYDKRNGKYNDIEGAKTDSASQYLLKKCTKCNMKDIEKEAFGYPEGYENICKCFETNIEIKINDSEESSVGREETQKDMTGQEDNSAPDITTQDVSPTNSTIDGSENGNKGIGHISDKKNDLLNVKVPTFLTALGGIILLVTLLYRVRYEHIRSRN